MSFNETGGEVVAVGLANFARWLDTVNFSSPNGTDSKIGIDGMTVAAVGLVSKGDEESKVQKYKTEQVSRLNADTVEGSPH